jgi:hypothetical protein
MGNDFHRAYGTGAFGYYCTASMNALANLTTELGTNSAEAWKFLELHQGIYPKAPIPATTETIRSGHREIQIGERKGRLRGKRQRGVVGEREEKEESAGTTKTDAAAGGELFEPDAAVGGSCSRAFGCPTRNQTDETVAWH